MVLFILITIIFILDYFNNIINYMSAKNVYKNKKIISKYDRSNTYFIVPVYKEEKIVNKMVHNFYDLSKKCNAKTIFVTNKKEKNDLTHNLIEKTINKEKLKDYITLIKYDKDNGIMSHQINYALEYIDSIDKSDYIVCLYNADSEVNYKHIEFLRNNINDNRVIQGYSYYINKNNIFMNGLVSWQNRWSFIFEAGRCGRKKTKIELLNAMNYVIGHSLYFKRNTIRKIGNIPEDSINEDAFMGVLFNYLDIEILPLPFFEKADFAYNLSTYIKQQCTWFNGPLFALQYFNKIRKNKSNNKYKRNIFSKNYYKLFIICFKLFLHAIYWISAFYILFILYGYLSFKFFGIYGILYVIVINYLNLLLFNYLSFLQIKKETRDNIKFSILQFPILSYFIHTLGPIMNIFKSLFGKNTINNKYKTER